MNDRDSDQIPTSTGVVEKAPFESVSELNQATPVNRICRWEICLTGILGIMMLFYCWNRFSIRSDMDQFLGTLGDSDMIKISRHLANSELSRTIILTLSAENSDGTKNVDVAVRVARDIANQLEHHAEVSWVRTGISTDQQKSIYELYFPRRFALMSDQPELDLPQQLKKENLDRIAKKLKADLGGGTGDLVKRLAPADPWQSYLDFLRRLEDMREHGMDLHEGQLISSDNQAVIFLATSSSAFDGSKQTLVQNFILQVLRRVRLQYQDRYSIYLEQSSVAQFAVAAEASIRQDITRISVGSTVMIVLFFALVFGSLRSVLLVFLPMLFGLLFATTITLFVYGQIHGLTLAFGSTLIGICIDYPIHLLNHRFFGQSRSGGREIIRKIQPALILGASTTLVGFCGLGWTSFPGVREIAFFSGSGIASALLITIFVVPLGLGPGMIEAGSWQTVASGTLLRLTVKIGRFRKCLVLLGLSVLLLLVLGLPSISFDDNVATWTHRDPKIVAEDSRVRGRVARMEGGQIVVALADDEETALRSNDEVFRQLQKVRSEGHLEDFRSLHSLLWSQELQEKNLQFLTRDRELGKYMLDALERHGFVREAFSPFLQDVGQLGVAPDCNDQRCLHWSQLKASPIGRWAQPFWLGTEGDFGIMTMLRGVNRPDKIVEAVESIPGVRYFDQTTLLGSIYGSHRKQILQLVGLGLPGVFLLVWLRYRKFASAALVCLPAIFAALTTLVILTFFGYKMHLLHAVCLLLILSMGVDYGVFLLESRTHPAEFSASLMSTIMACTSTLLAFGLLALSEHQALAAIGQTVSIGVVLSLLFSILGFAWINTPFDKKGEYKCR